MAVHLIYKSLPTVALRGMVVFPGMRLHFEVGREKSIRAIQTAVRETQKVFLVTQRSVAVEDPDRADLYEMGVIATVKQLVQSPDSQNVRVIVEGLSRAVITDFIKGSAYLVSDVKERRSTSIRSANADYVDALIRKTKAIFEEYAELTEKKAPDVALEVYLSQDPGHLADFIAGNALQNYEDRQRVLEELNPIKRLELLCAILTHEMTIFRIEDQIDQKVQDQMDQNQHEYYLREQLKVISDELGDTEDGVGEAQTYREKILSLGLEASIEQKLLKECSRLGKMQGTSPDANVIRTYLDTCLDLPWGVYTEDRLDLQHAREILDRDHYGMQKIKERFLEMLAVRALTDRPRAQIICLVGPPGVGKTSIVRSVAEAMGRNYVRMSLGGIRDEAEIRGHRKTYIGAMPGRIAAALTQAKSMNPILLLDEVDKLGADYKGDPSAALLEALDPEQNNTFRDHFLEFPLDLQQVLFITTANDASAIPGPLYDRMEVIELTSYTAEEKFHIARQHLLKKQLQLHGLTAAKLRVRDDVLRLLIERYTREAGVRRLEQLIAAVCRKGAVRLAESGRRSLTVNPALLEDMLGPPKYKEELPTQDNLVGVVNGLAWTSVGGELLQVEAVAMDGSGKLELTGSLGDVMKESAKAALSFVRSVADSYQIDRRVFRERDIHIHVPQGAVPKDGPSAGVTIATALLSALSGRPVRREIAMTGEISLTGRVMAIGGLREKSMAAYRSGISKVLIPRENESDLWEIDPAVKAQVEFLPVDRLEDVFRLALLPNPAAKKEETRAPLPGVQTKPKRDSIAQ